jgi:hypothetical protein
MKCAHPHFFLIRFSLKGEWVGTHLTHPLLFYIWTLLKLWSLYIRREPRDATVFWGLKPQFFVVRHPFTPPENCGGECQIAISRVW